MTTSQFCAEDFKRHMKIAEKFPIIEMAYGLSLSERFSRIRQNYRSIQGRIDAGDMSWMECNPYIMGDWSAVFSPIEEAAWHDVRASGLPLWPQLPVGRFFVDFGNPIVKIALECDGKQWHDPAKDAIRDELLNERGWKVFRAPEWRCNKVVDWPDNYEELTEHQKQDFNIKRQEETMAGLIAEIKDAWRFRA